MDDIIFQRAAQGVTSPQTGLILPEEIMVFDTETTGLSKERDDILQFSAIDGAGNTLMNQLFHPVRQQSWPDAERVNQITPQDVADAPLLEAMADDILQLFRSARLIVAYNVRFDYNMLLGNLPRQRRELCHIFKYSHAHHVYDVMWHFPAVYAETHPAVSRRKPQKLGACAAYYGYQCGRLHDALEDARATLHCFYHVIEGEILKGGGKRMSENEYQEKIDALEALLDEWENKESSPDGYINHQAHVFIRDGIVNEKPEKWYRQKYRPLFLLREAYGGDQGWDIRAYVRSVADRERKDRSWPTWYNVTRWAYGILKTSANGDFPSLPDNSIITTKSDDHPLKQIAVVNIKKSNGQKTSKLGDLMNYAKYDATEIWQEIELIDPTVIISANDPLIQDELAKKKGFEIDRQDFPSILKINGHDVILIEYHHPADFHYTNMTNYCKLMAMYQRAFRAIKNK